MDPCSSSEVASVKPLKFKSISEDDEAHDDARTLAARSSWQQQPARAHQNGAPSADKHLESNFSFQFAYPAVVFHDVCFSVYKPKQQGSLFGDTLQTLKSSLNCWSGQPRTNVNVLKSINLNIPHGSIFGLLGPSSCGKTTFLRCLVGLLEPTSGSIDLFGHNLNFSEKRQRCSGTPSIHEIRLNECRVPGANVGYMPQDLGLYEDYSIRRLLTTFGRFTGMDVGLIEERVEFMATFLDLPDVDRQVGTLSGGQKRRVSFAIACLHLPPLIILDEPTVGVDPLLRKAIWRYLRRLASKENRTIIITTHYIEEAAQADQVALMRAGEILVQDSPRRIMDAHNCSTLEEAFLKICNSVVSTPLTGSSLDTKSGSRGLASGSITNRRQQLRKSTMPDFKDEPLTSFPAINATELGFNLDASKLSEVSVDKLSVLDKINPPKFDAIASVISDEDTNRAYKRKPNRVRSLLDKTINGYDTYDLRNQHCDKDASKTDCVERRLRVPSRDPIGGRRRETRWSKLRGEFTLLGVLIKKNFIRNMNSIPLIAFQFLLPMIQMISFSLCVGGRPTGIGLGLVNHEQSAFGPPPALTNGTFFIDPSLNLTTSLAIANETEFSDTDQYLSLEPLSSRYLSFIDHTMLSVRNYDNVTAALEDVRKAKLWAVMEIGANFTSAVLDRFDLENFYQIGPDTIRQSVIRLYQDQSNKVLDMICHRSLINSYHKFLQEQFEHFKKLPMEIKEPVFEIKPNLISNSIDGYTESIAAGLLASLTYIMAAGLTTFIMVVERTDGILERTYTCGVNPFIYLVAHAIFRSLIMIAQIAAVMFLTFYLLKQPLVGSVWLAYLILMTLNLTGISYGLVISSLVEDQNGAALTIVSSLVVKITLSGILWPFEAIPRWLRFFCYVQPLTMPIQALKGITLKGSTITDRSVYLGFLVAITWLILFITVATRKFKFYQHSKT